MHPGKKSYTAGWKWILLAVSGKKQVRFLLPVILTRNELKMAGSFKTGDHVKWNSEAGRVSGKIIKIHKADFNYKGYTHHASKEDPQYEIRSDKSDHIAVHKGSALSKMRK